MTNDRRISGYKRRTVNLLEFGPIVLAILGSLGMAALYELNGTVPTRYILILVGVWVVIAAPAYTLRHWLISKHLDSLPDGPGDWEMDKSSSSIDLYFWRLGESGEYVYADYVTPTDEPKHWYVHAGAETEDEILENEAVGEEIDREKDALSVALQSMSDRTSPRPGVEETFAPTPEEEIGRSWVAVGFGILLLTPSLFGLYLGVSLAILPEDGEMTRGEFEEMKESMVSYMESRPDQFNESEIKEARNMTYEEVQNSEPHNGPVWSVIAQIPDWAKSGFLIVGFASLTLFSLSLLYTGFTGNRVSFPKISSRL